MLAPLSARAAGGGVVYDVSVTGLNDGTARDLFKETSVLLRQKSDPPATFAILQQWIQKDIRTLGKILRARAYYAGRVSYQVDRRVDPLKVSLLVETGPQYKIAEVTLDLVGADTGLDKGELLPLLPGEGIAGTAARILVAEKDMLARLPRIGYPLARAGDRRVMVRHGDRSMTVVYSIDPGPRVSFGAVRYQGLTSVKPAFLDRLRPWAAGDIYDDRLMAEFRDELAATSLFSSVATTLAPPGPDGAAPVDVKLGEADHRTYGGGVNYASEDGFGANVFWEHRNFLNGGEKVRTEATVSEIEQGLETSIIIPAFLRRDQSLILDLDLRREAPDAFESYGANLGAVVERELNQTWSVAVGGSVDYTRVRDQLGTRDFYLLGGLASVRRDTSDDLLDPREGSRAFLSVRPYVGDQGGLLEFTIAEVAGSVYLPLDNERRYVVAARAKAGTIAGAALERLPADKRFYAGGGQSLRGFGYQKAGDLDVDGDPVGGRSLVEVGAELRIRISDQIGIVPFIEGGRAFAGRTPRFDRDLFWGAGLGIRYFTSFAPIRLDVGFPLNPRPEDDDFQVYVSLGQSF